MYKVEHLDGKHKGLINNINTRGIYSLKKLLKIGVGGIYLSKLTNYSCVVLNTKERIVSGMLHTDPIIIKISKTA